MEIFDIAMMSFCFITTGVCFIFAIVINWRDILPSSFTEKDEEV